MSNVDTVSITRAWDAPLASEYGPVSLLELNDGRFALVHGTDQGTQGVIVSSAFAAAFKAEFYADPQPVFTEVIG